MLASILSLEMNIIIYLLWSRFSEKVKIVPQSTGRLLLKASVVTELLAYL